MAKDPIDEVTQREIERVGRVVASLMEWRNLTQEGLRERSGVNVAQIGRIVQASSDVGISAYIRVARGLGVPLFWLFTEECGRFIAEHEPNSEVDPGGGVQGG